MENTYRTRAYILTQTEVDFYKQLIKVVPEEKGILFKVNLADILAPTNSEYGKKQSSRNKINKKHVDFLIYNKENFFIDMAIELDDFTHESKKNAENDEVKNQAFESAEIPLHRVKVEQDYTKQLENIFKKKEEIAPKEADESKEEEDKKRKAFFARRYYAKKNAK